MLIIPGNHDINNSNAAVYYGDEGARPFRDRGMEFYDIYHQYGYDQAFSRDEDRSATPTRWTRTGC